MTFLDEKGFESKAIRTDYKFNDLNEAVELCRTFFGPKKAKKVTANNWVVLPESTGIWWRTKTEEKKT